MRLLTSATGDDTHELGDEELRALYAFPDVPWLRVNFVTTLDGSGVGPDGLTGSINTPPDNRVFALNRDLPDCVLVGSGTARSEGYEPGDVPIVVVSGRGVLPPTLDQGGGRLVLATCAASGREPSADVWVCGTDTVDLTAAKRRLAAEGMYRILCEGGPTLHSDLLAAHLVDDLALTIVPKLAGGSGKRITKGDPLTLDAAPVHLLEEGGALLGLWRFRL